MSRWLVLIWWGLALALSALPASPRSFPSTPDAQEAAQQRWGSVMQGYVMAGCLNSTSPSTSVSVPPCRAAALDTNDPATLKGFEETSATPLTFSAGAGTYTLAGRWTPTLTPPGWTCQPGTHYCWHYSSAAVAVPVLPAIPSGLVVLSQSTVTGSAVTVVRDRRAPRPDTTAIDVTAPLYGMDTDPTTDDAPAIRAACAALPGGKGLGSTLPVAHTTGEQGGLLYFPPGRTYLINSPVPCQLHHNTVVEMGGSRYTSTVDGLWFDLNPGVQFGPIPGLNDTTVHTAHVRGYGAVFDSNAATKTASLAFKAWGFRNLTISGFHLLDFHTAISYGGKDTYTFQDLMLANHVYGIYHPTAAETGRTEDGDITLMTNIRQVHFASNAARVHLALGDRIWDLSVYGSSFNGIDEAPPEGDGLASIWFRNGELLSQGIVIEANHFEQLKGGTSAILFRDLTGQVFDTVTIRGNTFGSGTPGWGGIVTERVRGLTIADNKWRDGSGGNTEFAYTLDANTQAVTIGREIYDFMDTKLTGTISRDRVMVLPEVTNLANTYTQLLTGYNGQAFAADATDVVVDMSAAWEGWGLLTITPPKGYWGSIQCESTTSAVGGMNGAVVTAGQEASPLSVTRLACDARNVAAGTRRTVHGYIPADTNGDFKVSVLLTGGGTATVTVRILAVHQ